MELIKMLKNRKTKHNINDIVFSSGAFYGFEALPMKVIHVEKNIVTAEPLTTIPLHNAFEGSHLDFFNLSEILVLKPEFEDKYPDIFGKNNSQTNEVVSCCKKYTSKFCPECGKLITK